jgi:hypothetical protein
MFCKTPVGELTLYFLDVSCFENSRRLVGYLTGQLPLKSVGCLPVNYSDILSGISR